MWSWCLPLLRGHWEVNGITVIPYYWHRVLRGWWMLSPSPLPLWQRVAGRGVVGVPRSKLRGPEQRRHCRSPWEVMLAAASPSLPCRLSPGHTAGDMAEWPSLSTAGSLFPSCRHRSQRRKGGEGRAWPERGLGDWQHCRDGQCQR